MFMKSRRKKKSKEDLGLTVRPCNRQRDIEKEGKKVRKGRREEEE
jgi:hypothetical protein